ncbi:MAG TPA: PDZ domain-containing protein [Gemmataceae bacterium]|nr:PDZ domain-containing protein [Gemmataceae bacterium]
MYTALTLAAALSVGAPALKSKEEPLGKGPGYMGITFSQACEGGLVITEIKPGGPAEKAGLKENDVLLKANDVELRDVDTTKFVDLIASMRPNQVVTFQVARNGEGMTVKLKLGARPADFEALRPARRPPIDDE